MTCGHIWPAELTQDAQCLLGCGLAYGEWSDEDTGHEATSLTPTKEIEVPA